MLLKVLVKLCVVSMVLVALPAHAAAKRERKSRRHSRGPKPTRGPVALQGFGCPAENEMNKNISALWMHMKFLSQPIQVHVHNGDHHDDHGMECDDYFGCHHRHHDHDNHGHEHSNHTEGKHNHKHDHHHDHHDHDDHHDHHNHDHKDHHNHDHKGHHGHDHKDHHNHDHKGHHGHDHKGHHGHGHKGHDHKNHDNHDHDNHDHHDHHSHHAFANNHIHIHVSLDDHKGCDHIKHAFKDEFVYARCDVVPDNKMGSVEGSIFMRQRPHRELQTKIQLKGFKGPSAGAVDGQHDFFYDVHDFADFSRGCSSFGGHTHVHGDDGHKHAEIQGHDHHNHNHEDGHNHTVHDHHTRAGDWGNIVVDDNGVVNMEVNCTHHELYGPKSMFGRGLLLHNKNDQPIGCCAITYANIDDDSWEQL